MNAARDRPATAHAAVPSSDVGRYKGGTVTTTFFPARVHRWGRAGVAARVAVVLAGVLATLPELMLMYAPNVNSYKRFVAGSWAPTSVTWGFENRTVALRAICN